MKQGPQTRLSSILANPEWTDDLSELAAHFYDQSATWRLEGVGASAPIGIGAHIRRSFLGAMGPGASPEAQAGRPCQWDPPCALDVFCREQLRGPRGDGLPKPYVVACAIDNGDLIVTLRVFGMANDWFLAACEAMVEGLRSILPWSRLYPGRKQPPRILARSVDRSPLPRLPENVNAVRLVLCAPMDATGIDLRASPHRVLSRLLRRVDGISRWNGVALSDEAGRSFANSVASLRYDTDHLLFSGHLSPNARGQRRVKQTATGVFGIQGDIGLIWPVITMGERCHHGRGAVEGLGAFRIDLSE